MAAAISAPVTAVSIIAMAHPLSTPHRMPAETEPAREAATWSGAAWFSLAAGAFGAVALLGALVLWFHYGTTVFFETIAAGISACF